MRTRDVIIGMKVVPVHKSVMNSDVYKMAVDNGQTFLYVYDTGSNKQYALSYHKNNPSALYYTESKNFVLQSKATDYHMEVIAQWYDEYMDSKNKVMLDQKQIEIPMPDKKDSKLNEEFKSMLSNIKPERGISDYYSHDPVSNPSHYTSGKIECIDAIEEAVSGLSNEESYLTGNIIKYMWRWKKKNGVEDLKKAQWYLTRLISKQETT